MGSFGLVGSIPSISRTVKTIAAGLVSLGVVGIVFAVRAPDNSNSPIYRCETASGSQTCIFTGSGSASFSGVVLSHAGLTSSGVLTISGSLALNVKTFSGSFTVEQNANTMIVDASGTAPTIVTLPAASNVAEKTYTVKRTDDSGNILEVRIDTWPGGGDTIDGSGAFLLPFQYDSVDLLSDGSVWHIH